MGKASLHGCQCRVRCRWSRHKSSMCSNQGIDNFPTVDTTPSGILIVIRSECSKVFKLLTHHQSFTACAPHQTASFPDRTSPLLRSTFSSRLRLEIASAKCQAHDSQGAKNDENNVLRRVIDLLGSGIGHWNSPFLRVDRLWLSESTRLILSYFFHGSSIPECTASY